MAKTETTPNMEPVYQNVDPGLGLRVVDLKGQLRFQEYMRGVANDFKERHGLPQRPAVSADVHAAPKAPEP